MQMPKMFEFEEVAAETFVLPSYVPIPGLGGLADNAYLIRGAQPTLIDAGIGALCSDFMAQLEALIDPKELRWIWITHMDSDHIGALENILACAPHAKVITTFLGMGKLNMRLPIAPQRAYLLNPGQELDIGDRTLRALRPPIYDAPETTGLMDLKTRALFTSDSFGALTPQAYNNAKDIPADELEHGVITWATADAPWIHSTTEESFASALDAVRSMEASTILSSHLPPATGMNQTLIDCLQKSRSATPFVGPDQAALIQSLGH
jgi:flavorubredoxin